jgi:hypothetical protein
MDYQKVRNCFAAMFFVSIGGWVLFGLFFAPDDLLDSASPIVPSTDPSLVWHFLLLAAGVLAPVVSALGCLATTILDIREQNRESETLTWDFD